MTRTTPDYYVLNEMRRCIALHLQKALKECEALSRDLHHLNPITITTDIARQFDPADDGPIQDAFVDSFYYATRALAEDGFEEPFTRATLPSGLPKV